MKRSPLHSPDSFQVYYLPHHGVFSHSNDNPKLRVVFNGSSKTSGGTSLNDLLHTGAKLQNDLIDVLCWFRKFRIVFSTDVEKMYRQVMVHPDDWRFQRILWKDPHGNVIDYSLTTVTYGLACAPFLALRSFKQLVEDEGTRYPLAVPVLTHGRYVDDIFGGGDSVEDVEQIVQQVDQLSMAGGFPLRKWVSNRPEALNGIPTAHHLSADSVSINQVTPISTLGLSWQPSEDVFTFSPGSFTAAPFTKRSVSSKIARFFDPMGFIAPVIIRAKILLQQLWAIGSGRDDPVPDNTAQEWVEFTRQLSDLPCLRFPRWSGTTDDCDIELHGFSDASQAALAAAVYVRVVRDNTITVSFLCAKTKVTPLKRLTIPRLELVAATLLTRLISHVSQTLHFTNNPIYLWVDSSIVHTWVNNHPSKWREYVHNRVTFIQETLPTAKWNFIPGHENPADCASRGLTPSELLKTTSWFNGPSWLSMNPTNWPNALPTKPHEELMERKSTITTHVVCERNHEPWDLVSRYSHLTRLLRITAICQRAVKKWRYDFEGSIKVPLTPDELLDAKYYWLHQTQRSAYDRELTVLKSQENLKHQNPLIPLTPFVDAKGIMRVGGRLKNSSLSYENKHPFTLPRTSHLSNLIIADAHT